MKRRLGREKAIQALFAIEVGESDKDIILEQLLKRIQNDNSTVLFTRELVDGVLQNISDIDNYIKKYAKGWELDRIAKVELCAMRLAIYEILYLEKIPPLVSINEALELVKYFSSEESVKFVNGVLNKVYKGNVREN